MVSNRLRELRKKNGLTQVELAERLGVTQTAIYKLETGASDLDTKWMEKLSKILNVRPYELLPKEWQPQEITEEERQLLELFRKKTNIEDSTIQTEDKANRYKSKQR